LAVQAAADADVKTAQLIGLEAAVGSVAVSIENPVR
jgi:hypothetical protein